MKKIFIYFIFFQLAFTACKKAEVEPLFDTSANQRATAQVDNYKKLLTGSEFGWRGEYYPDGGNGKGYSFYLKFDATGKTIMYSDIDGFYYFENGYDKAFETTYQVKSLQKPTLIFDSYSYLSELVNPDYNGGTGQSADLELEFTSLPDNNTVTLIGRKNKTEMKLTKIAKTESDLLAKGGFANTFNNTFDYANAPIFLTLVLPTGEKTDVKIDTDGKVFGIYFINKSREADGFFSPYVTTATGILLKTPITVFGITFQELFWDDVKKVYYINVNNNRINLLSSSKPNLSFYDALGNLFISFNMSPAIPSQTAEYKALYTKIKANTITLSTAPPTRVIGNVYFQYLTSTGDFVLVVNYTRTNPDGTFLFNGSSVLYFKPTLDAKGNLSFGKSYQNATLSGGQLSLGASGIVLAGIKPLTDIIENNIFQWDYDPIETRIAVLKSVATTANPTVFTIKGALF